MAFVRERSIDSAVAMALEQFRREPLYVAGRDQARPEILLPQHAPHIGAEAAPIVSHRMISLNVSNAVTNRFVKYVEVHISLNASIIWHRTPIF